MHLQSIFVLVLSVPSTVLGTATCYNGKGTNCVDTTKIQQWTKTFWCPNRAMDETGLWEPHTDSSGKKGKIGKIGIYEKAGNKNSTVLCNDAVDEIVKKCLKQKTNNITGGISDVGGVSLNLWLCPS